MGGIAELSTGCMESIMNGVQYEKPVLQILGTKKISGAEGTERFRLLVSDGKYLNSFAMLATQLNDLHAQGKLVENTIVRVERYITSMVNKSEKGDKRVLIILDLTVLNLGSEVGKKVGNPVPYTGSEKQSNPVAPASTSSNERGNFMKTNSGPLSSFGKHTSGGTNRGEPMDVSIMSQSMNSGTTHPIASLSPYQNKWVVKARVTSKSAIRTWSNAKGEGKLFSMDLMDESGEIRATVFKEQVDKFYDMIAVDKVYFISRCTLKPANKQYSSLNNDYEMTFTNDTMVQLCDDVDDIPEIHYDFVPISQIANMEAKAVLDVIGVCRDIGELQIFTGRTNAREFKKREVTLVDSSNASVQLTLWGDEAVNFEGHVQPVVLVKGVRISEFGGGKSLSISNGSTLKVNPDIPEGHKLRGWFDNGGAENVSVSVSSKTGGIGGINTEWMTFYEARENNLGFDDKPGYFQTYAVIHIVRQANCVYKACPQADCNKKVIDDENGSYRCEKCNSTSPNFKYRLLVNMCIGDWTSSRWVTCFSDVAEKIFGCNAQEIGEALENDPERADKIFSSAHFKEYVFKLRTKVEIFGDTQRNKITVVGAEPLNHKEYDNYLLKNLQELIGVGKH